MRLVVVFVALIALIVLPISAVVRDVRRQWPRGECLNRGYAKARYTMDAMYCIKTVNGTSVVLKLGRYRDQ